MGKDCANEALCIRQGRYMLTLYYLSASATQVLDRALCHHAQIGEAICIMNKSLNYGALPQLHLNLPVGVFGSVPGFLHL